MTDLEALAKLATEDAKLWAGYGRGDGKNDADYLAVHTKYQQAASPDVVLALVRVAQAAAKSVEWGDVGGLLLADVVAVRAALADLDD